MDVEDEGTIVNPVDEDTPVNEASPEKEQLDAIAAILSTNQVKPVRQANQAKFKARFIDAEAEEGSDNELHDEVIKHAGHSDEEGLVE